MRRFVKGISVEGCCCSGRQHCSQRPNRISSATARADGDSPTAHGKLNSIFCTHWAASRHKAFIYQSQNHCTTTTKHSKSVMYICARTRTRTGKKTRKRAQKPTKKPPTSHARQNPMCLIKLFSVVSNCCAHQPQGSVCFPDGDTRKKCSESSRGVCRVQRKEVPWSSIFRHTKTHVTRGTYP